MTYNAIIEGLCAGGKVMEAESFFRSFKDKGLDNYAAAMIIGYCDAKMTRDAYNLYVSLTRRGIIVNKNSCLTLLNSLCLDGAYKGACKDALMVFKNILVSDGVPCQTICGKLIAAFCSDEDMTNAQWVFDSMILEGVIPDVITYTTMLNGYCRLNCLKEACDLFSDMKERGIKPDIITYTVLIHGHSSMKLIKALKFDNKDGSREDPENAMTF